MLLSPGIPEARDEHWALPVFQRVEGNQVRDELGAQGIPGLKSQGGIRGGGDRAQVIPRVLLEFLRNRGIQMEINGIRSWETIPDNSLAGSGWESGSDPREKGWDEREWPQAEPGMEYLGEILHGEGWEGWEWAEQGSGNCHS